MSMSGRSAGLEESSEFVRLRLLLAGAIAGRKHIL